MESKTIKQTPSVESPVFPSAHHMPSSGGQPPVSVRRPPSSGPPPIPSRVDLGEAPVDAASSIKKPGRDDLPSKGSPKLRYEGVIIRVKFNFFHITWIIPTSSSEKFNT